MSFLDILRAFTDHVHKGPAEFTERFAEKLGIPYLKEREGECFLGHRLREDTREEALAKGLLATRRFRGPNGDILETNEFPDMSYEQLTDEVWSRDNWPTSYNDVIEGLRKVPDGILGVYYHMPSLNIVLVSPTGELVGIRWMSLRSEYDVKTLEKLKRISVV